MTEDTCLCCGVELDVTDGDTELCSDCTDDPCDP